MEKGKIRVMLVDDHPMVREGLRTFLQLSDQMEIVAEAESGPDACAAVEKQEVDVVLMDLVMPGAYDGIEAIRILTAKHDTKVIALTSFQDRERILGALDAGAIGYLQKDIRPDDLVSAIVQAANGRTVLEAEALLAIRQQQVLPIANDTSNSSFVNVPVNQHRLVVPDYIEPLTERELEVLQTIALGMSNKEIADHLGIAEKTVKVHVSHILSKLGVYDRTQALLVASKLGIVKLQ